MDKRIYAKDVTPNFRELDGCWNCKNREHYNLGCGDYESTCKKYKDALIAIPEEQICDDWDNQ